LPALLPASLQSIVTAGKEVHHEVLVLSDHCYEVSDDSRVVSACTDLDAPEAVSEITANFSSLFWALKILGLMGLSGLGRNILSGSVPVALPRRVDTILKAGSSSGRENPDQVSGVSCTEGSTHRIEMQSQTSRVRCGRRRHSFEKEKNRIEVA
jgi:hypothetical protein